jgi:uncharacterized protein involved in exopolysaccharide biosynthesis
MTFQQFLHILLARKKLIALLLTLVVVVGGVTTVLMPKSYTATSAVVAFARPDRGHGAARHEPAQLHGHAG